MESASTDSASRLEKLTKKVEDNPESALDRARLGTALFKAGFIKKAEQELKKAIEIDSECVPALVNLGGLLLSRWDFPGCVEANRRAAACDPELLEAHYNQGLGHLYQGQAQEMVACFRRVVELDGSHPGGRYHLAVALLAIGEEQEARFELTKAMQLGYKPEPEFLKALNKEEKGDLNLSELEPKPDKQPH